MTKLWKDITTAEENGMLDAQFRKRLHDLGIRRRRDTKVLGEQTHIGASGKWTIVPHEFSYPTLSSLPSSAFFKILLQYQPFSLNTSALVSGLSACVTPNGLLLAPRARRAKVLVADVLHLLFLLSLRAVFAGTWL